MKIRTILLAGALASLGLVALGPAAAQADTPAGSGSVGRAHAFFESPPLDVHIDALAACTVGGAGAASTPGATARDYVSFGTGSTSCTTDAAGAATVTVSGRNFTFDWMKGHGGPVIKLASFSVTCSTTANGSRSSIRLAGLSGIRAPGSIPANYSVTIPASGPALARIVLNETVVPDPPDGSMTVNLMHVRLFPDSYGFNTGEVVVGTAHCSPRG
jgi:hypothetical protein